MSTPLACPFPPRSNPYAAFAEALSDAWANRFALFPSSSPDRRHLLTSSFGRLASRSFPGAGHEVLTLCAEWLTWLHAHGDLCEYARAGEVARLHQRLGAVLDGEWGQDDPPLVRALEDICRRVDLYGNSECSFRFRRSVGSYLWATRWEVHTREARRLPDLATYNQMRRHSGGVYTCLELLDLVARIDLPDMVRDEPTLERLGDLVNDILCTAHDLALAERDPRSRKGLDLVSLIQLELGVDRREALSRARARYDGAVAELTALTHRVPLFTQDVDLQVGRLLDCLCAMISGHVDWTQSSRRAA
jgi:hypothetical protein